MTTPVLSYPETVAGVLDIHEDDHGICAEDGFPFPCRTVESCRAHGPAVAVSVVDLIHSRQGFFRRWCAECATRWPCDTKRLLNQAV